MMIQRTGACNNIQITSASIVGVNRSLDNYGGPLTVLDFSVALTVEKPAKARNAN